MFGIDNIWSFLLAATLIILVPGPATIYVAGKAARGVGVAVRAIGGIIAGDVVLITLAGFGFAALASRWPSLVAAINVIGAVYVAYLGVELLRSTPSPAIDDAPASARNTFVKGLLITLTNPKPILFFAVFFPMFIERSATSRIASFYALGALFEAINVVYFATIVAVVASLHRARTFNRYSAGTFNRVSGGALVACSVLLLVTALR